MLLTDVPSIKRSISYAVTVFEVSDNQSLSTKGETGQVDVLAILSNLLAVISVRRPGK